MQCLPPARLHKIRHVQLVWRHDDNLPVNRISSECVSFSTSTVTILIQLPPQYKEHSQFQRSHHVMDDNDEPWATEVDHRTGWNKTFKSGTYRGMLDLFCATIRNKLYHWTKQRASPQTCVSFSPWHTDVIASTCPPAGMPASAATCPGGCKEFSHKGSNAHSIRLTCKICGTVRKEERHPQRQDPATCSHRHTDHRGEQRTHAKDVLC